MKKLILSVIGCLILGTILALIIIPNGKVSKSTNSDSIADYDTMSVDSLVCPD